MRSPQDPDLFALARGLALSARRRGLSARETPAAIARSLPRLLVDQPDLQQVLVALVRRPACMALLEAERPQPRALAREQLLDRGGLGSTAAISSCAEAFVDGLVEGWHQQGRAAAGPDGAQEPDLRTWLMGLGTGVLIGGVLSWLGLAFVQVAVPPPRPAADGAAPVGGAPAPLDAALRRCTNLAPPQSESQQLASASNFGKRLSTDASGAAIPATPGLIVLHETVLDLPATIALFQRNQASDAAQVSYHVLIGREGQRVRIVPDQARAFGAGDSGFGDLRLKTSATNPPSINNIALHVSLETPADGRGDTDAHGGYTPEQYRALAEQVLRWQALYGIPIERVTTHAAVDRSHSRYDPRSFRWERFDQAYQQARLGCA